MMLTAFSINSMDITISTALRRAKTPYSPITNRAALNSWKATKGTISYRLSSPVRAMIMAPIRATNNTRDATSKGMAHRVKRELAKSLNAGL